MPVKKTKLKPKSNLDFRLMSLSYKFRDFIKPRMRVLDQVGIEEGFHVLDYGCGSGSYIVALAELVGKSGKIYALDIHPLAIQAVRRIAAKKGITNVQTILSDCQTGLPSNSVDVVLLYDILHNLEEPGRVLAELHRVLRTKGILSLSDHHLKEEEIISQVTGGGLFKLSAKGKRTYSLTREERK
jgi:ubiquinone/menaquinone biosynthesis C-methylase UbiE